MKFGVRRSVTLAFELFRRLQPCAVDFSSGAARPGCSDEAALRLTDREETREQTGLQRAKEETPSIYRQRQNERSVGGGESENRADKGTRGEKEAEVQEQKDLEGGRSLRGSLVWRLSKQERSSPVWMSGATKGSVRMCKEQLANTAGVERSAPRLQRQQPWYSGDIAALARSRSLSSVTVATYFLHGNSISRCVQRREKGAGFIRVQIEVRRFDLQIEFASFCNVLAFNGTIYRVGRQSGS